MCLKPATAQLIRHITSLGWGCQMNDVCITRQRSHILNTSALIEHRFHLLQHRGRVTRHARGLTITAATTAVSEGVVAGVEQAASASRTDPIAAKDVRAMCIALVQFAN